MTLPQLRVPRSIQQQDWSRHMHTEHRYTHVHITSHTAHRQTLRAPTSWTQTAPAASCCSPLWLINPNRQTLLCSHPSRHTGGFTCRAGWDCHGWWSWECPGRILFGLLLLPLSLWATCGCVDELVSYNLTYWFISDSFHLLCRRISILQINVKGQS